MPVPRSLASVQSPSDKPVAAASARPLPVCVKEGEYVIEEEFTLDFHLVNLLHCSGAVDEFLELVFVHEVVGNDE